jgi:hypothetical protein
MSRPGRFVNGGASGQAARYVFRLPFPLVRRSPPSRFLTIGDAEALLRYSRRKRRDRVTIEDTMAEVGEHEVRWPSNC